MRKITIENSEESYTDDNASLIAASFKQLGSEYDAKTFDEYTQKVIKSFRTILPSLICCVVVLVRRSISNLTEYETR